MLEQGLNPDDTVDSVVPSVPGVCYVRLLQDLNMDNTAGRVQCFIDNTASRVQCFIGNTAGRVQCSIDNTAGRVQYSSQQKYLHNKQ